MRDDTGLVFLFLLSSFKNPFDFRKARTGLLQVVQNMLFPIEYSLYPTEIILPFIVFLQESHFRTIIICFYVTNFCMIL